MHRAPLPDTRPAGLLRALVPVALAGAVFAGSGQATGLPWEIWESPARLATLDAGASVLLRSSHCLDGCRYDRSNAGSADVGNTWPERWLYRDGDEVVVFDERGPGAVTRIWLTTGFGTSSCIDPATRVRIYVDGAPTPTLDVPLAALFDGSTPPFSAPLVADHLQASGGYVSHVPIAYAQSLRIALLDADNGGINPCTGNAQRLLWFQIQHHRLLPGTPVSAFEAGHDEPGWRAFLGHAGDDPWHAMLLPQNGNATLAPGATLALAARGGVGWLRGIRLHLPRAAYVDVNLRLHFDGEQSVDMPLADFFATSEEAAVPPRGVLLGEDAAGWLYVWFPMPFTQSAAVELVASATLPASVQVASATSFDDEPVPASAGRFAATLTDTCTGDGDVTLYDARGAGKLVGLAATYRSIALPSAPTYLEGDERAYVDDGLSPAWYGTGIEDFFDGGFYFDQGAFSSALAGASVVRSGGDYTTSVWRLLLGDALAYSRALRLTQETGLSPSLPSPACVRAVTHVYRQARPLQVRYGGFEIGDAVAASSHAYEVPVGAVCAPLAAQFADEPPTARDAVVCRYADGASRFRFRLAHAAAPLRLARVFDAGAGVPGSIAGAPAARIFANGVEVGRFPPAMANPARRWQHQVAALQLVATSGDLQFEIVPEFSADAVAFSESAWELQGGWIDAIFASGFDAPAPLHAEADHAK
jgi:hypothetical protein